MRIIRLPGRSYADQVINNAIDYNKPYEKVITPDSNIRQWSHLAITRTHNDMYVYVNGEMVVQTPIRDNTFTVDFWVNQVLRTVTEFRVTDGVDRYAAGNPSTG